MHARSREGLTNVSLLSYLAPHLLTVGSGRIADDGENFMGSKVIIGGLLRSSLAPHNMTSPDERVSDSRADETCSSECHLWAWAYRWPRELEPS